VAHPQIHLLPNTGRRRCAADDPWTTTLTAEARPVPRRRSAWSAQPSRAPSPAFPPLRAGHVQLPAAGRHARPRHTETRHARLERSREGHSRPSWGRAPPVRRYQRHRRSPAVLQRRPACQARRYSRSRGRDGFLDRCAQATHGDSLQRPRSKEPTDERFRRSTAVWWAWLDLNQRPHPYQVSRAQRCADRRFPRSPPSVRAEGMRSNALDRKCHRWRLR
jgi:hypothetical protein